MMSHNTDRAALCLMLVDGADDVIRVAEILRGDLVELTLLLWLQRALLITHTIKTVEKILCTRAVVHECNRQIS